MRALVAQSVPLDEFGSMSPRAHVFVALVTLAVLVSLSVVVVVAALWRS